MLPATRALRARGAAGSCLPDVFESLAREGIHLRASQMSMVVAAPGVGKSALATIYAASAGVGTLYVSADTDPHTMTCRLASAVTGDAQEAIDEALRAGDGEHYLEAVDALTYLQTCFDGSPSTDDIFAEVDCYAMVYGMYPELLVVDNLSDVFGEGDERSSTKATLDELHEFARDSGTHVMVLHHSTGEYEDGSTPIPLSGLIGKTGKKPELILTLYRITDAWTDAMGVCPVKNRNGRNDASAKWTIWLKRDLDHMRLDSL